MAQRSFGLCRSTALKRMIISRPMADGVARKRAGRSLLSKGVLDDLVGQIERLANRLESAREALTLEAFKRGAGIVAKVSRPKLNRPHDEFALTYCRVGICKPRPQQFGLTGSLTACGQKSRQAEACPTFAWKCLMDKVGHALACHLRAHRGTLPPAVNARFSQPLAKTWSGLSSPPRRHSWRRFGKGQTVARTDQGRGESRHSRHECPRHVNKLSVRNAA